MVKKSGLGKGLGALISETFEETINESTHGLSEIKINDITPNELQPRNTFNESDLEALSVSIKRNGIIQPLVLRPLKKGYEIIAGERRWRAAKMVGLKTVPAVIMDPDEQKLYEIALIENMQRVDLNPIEEALAYQSLIKQFNMTQAEVSQVVGKSRSNIANTLRLLQLSEDVQVLITNNDISAGHAKVLIGLSELEQVEIAKQIAKEALSVREAENLIKKIKVSKNKEIKKDEKNFDQHFYKEFKTKLEDVLGSKVSISKSNNIGKITIDFYDDEDFERIYNIIEQ